MARRLGTGVNTPTRWRYDTSRGTGGAIPRKYHDQLIELAREAGIELPRGAFADPALAQEILRRHREERNGEAA